jgi:hypothetical protein
MSTLYDGFLGAWELLPETCLYEQGDPPRSGSYDIRAEGAQLVFTARWVDAEGAEHEATFCGPPDGTHVPFAGGDLADALEVRAVSARELNSYAYYRGVQRMVAQRQLDDTGQHMRIVQLVRLPGGTGVANSSIYRRVWVN